MQSLTAALWVETDDTGPGEETQEARSQCRPGESAAEGPAEEALVGAALLTVTAFRLRDATGLVEALRALTEALDAFLRARQAA
jgi:hypothetical protein